MAPPLLPSPIKSPASRPCKEMSSLKTPRASQGLPGVPPLVKLRGVVTATCTLSFIIFSAAVGARVL